MSQQELEQIKEILKIQFHIPEIDFIRNEIGKCFEVDAYHGCITLTNLLLERYCKLVLIYKATGFKSIQNLKDLENDFKPANKKYSSMSLGDTLMECKNQQIIDETAYDFFTKVKLRFRDGFSHGDASQILKGQTGNFALGKFDGSVPLEIKNMAIQNVPPFHGIAIQYFAEKNAFGYFVSVENLIRKTLRTYINDTFEIDLKIVSPKAFKDSDDLYQRLDWQILQNGWASLYYRKEILNIDLEWFKKENFKIERIDCAEWTSEAIIHQHLKRVFHFPEYYGANLSALNDCLSDLVIEQVGIVIVFENFELVGKKYGHQILDIFASNSRSQLLFGKKLICLVQVNDPKFVIEPVGASAVIWNGAEWLNSKRDL